jgi:DNA-directed RNA polymerase subunit M/transcription elongation factor TFIIS
MEGGPDAIRRRARGALAAVAGDAAMAEDLERGIFNAAVAFATAKGIVRNWQNPRFAEAYVSAYRYVRGNLDPSCYVGNTRLFARLVEGEFAPHEVPSMRPEHAFPEVWKDVLDRKVLKDSYRDKPESMTDQYKCKKCKKNKTAYTELQTRSADEPMSVFISCLTCGNRWRL